MLRGMETVKGLCGLVAVEFCLSVEESLHEAEGLSGSLRKQYHARGAHV